jgi:formylglycine-generating enzyme required for sulfatase activity
LPSAAEWELAAQPGQSEAAGIVDLLGGVSEWTTASLPAKPELEDSNGTAPRERFVVLGGGFKSGRGAAAAPATRLYMNASAIGRNVGFRCASSLQGSGSAS